MGPCPSRVLRTATPLVSLYPPGMALALWAPANQQLANGIGVSTQCGAVSTRENSVIVPGLLELSRYERMSEPGMGPILPGCGLIGRLGLPHRAGRYQPGGFRFRPPFDRVVDAWKDFRTVDGALSSPDGAGSIYNPQTISGQPAVLGFPHRAWRRRPGRTLFLPTGWWSCKYREIFMIQAWSQGYPPRVALALRPPANQRSANGIGISTPCRAFSTREKYIFIPGVSAL